MVSVSYFVCRLYIPTMQKTLNIFIYQLLIHTPTTKHRAVDLSGTCTNEPDVVNNADVDFVSARECCEVGLGLGGEGTCPFDDICFPSTPAPTPGATEGSTPTVSKAVTSPPIMNNAGRGDSRN